MGKRLEAKWGGSGGEGGAPRQKREKRRREGGRAGCWAKEAKRCWIGGARPPRDPRRAAWRRAGWDVGRGEEIGGVTSADPKSHRS